MRPAAVVAHTPPSAREIFPSAGPHRARSLAHLSGLGGGRRVDVLRECGHRVVEVVRLARDERRDEREELLVVNLA